MKSVNLKTTVLMLVMIIFILACGLPSSGSTEVSSTNVPTQLESPTEALIEHVLIPVNLPIDRSSNAGDYDSSTGQFPGGDRFTFGRFERPFNADTMDIYFAEIDIIDTSVFQDETWIYGKIIVKGNETNSLSGKYALELDTDVDGKGDWLVLASAPTSTDWTTAGVQVYEDANNDVGNASAMYTDENAISDGFEAVIFNQGKGDDPDSAWVRISTEAQNIIEFSVKRSVLGNPEKYLINMWAGNSLDPSLFDINDLFTHEQAGAADPGLEIFYPIKGVSEIDNSCRMAVGFQPVGTEAGLCEVLANSLQPGPTTCAVPNSCLGCGYTWNPVTCTCSQVAC